MEDNKNQYKTMPLASSMIFKPSNPVNDSINPRGDVWLAPEVGTVFKVDGHEWFVVERDPILYCGFTIKNKDFYTIKINMSEHNNDFLFFKKNTVGELVGLNGDDLNLCTIIKNYLYITKINKKEAL